MNDNHIVLLIFLGISLISIVFVAFAIKQRFLLKEDKDHTLLVGLAAFAYVVGFMGTVLLPLDVVMYDSKDYDEKLASLVWKCIY